MNLTEKSRIWNIRQERNHEFAKYWLLFTLFSVVFGTVLTRLFGTEPAPTPGFWGVFWKLTFEGGWLQTAGMWLVIWLPFWFVFHGFYWVRSNLRDLIKGEVDSKH